MSAKTPGAGRVGKEWPMVEPDSEIKLVQVSGGTSRARFLCEMGWFVNYYNCSIMDLSTFDSESFELDKIKFKFKFC